MTPVHAILRRCLKIRLRQLKTLLTGTVPEEQKRFFAIKLLEKDDKIQAQMKSVPDVSAEIQKMEELFDDDTESIITNERYVYISSIIHDCVKKNKQNKMTTSDKIDHM